MLWSVVLAAALLVSSAGPSSGVGQGTHIRDIDGGGVPKSKRFARCSFLDGIYTSVMRRIFNQGFHKYLKLSIYIFLSSSFVYVFFSFVVFVQGSYPPK